MNNMRALPVFNRMTRLWRWLMVLFVVVIALLMLQLHVLHRDVSSLTPPREWALSTYNHSIASQPLAHEEPPLGSDRRKTILPSSRGRVLVTGGGGMIGKRVVRRLLQANVPVTVLDTIFFQEEVDAIERDFPRGKLRVLRGDIRDPKVLKDAMEGAAGVIHLAAVSRVLWCLENLNDCTDVNVRGTELVIKALSKGWLIQASSREVYGNLDVLPVVEDSKRSPANVYGKSKSEAEDVITKHIQEVTNNKSKKINAVMLRLSNVYGSTKDHPERLIPAIMRNALSNRPIQMVGGDQDLDMVFVEDVVDAISLAVTRLDSKTYGWLGSRGEVETFNVGTSRSTSAMTLIRKTLWLTNSSSPLRVIPADNRFPSRYVGSTLKASTVLGYTARVSIDEGLYRLATETLGETIDYLKAKRAAEPFNCDETKRYSIDDLMALNDCGVHLSTLMPNGDVRYNKFHRADKQGRWNDTNGFDDVPNPTVWTLKATSSDNDDQEARVTFEVAQGDATFKLGIPSPAWGVDSDYEFLARIDPTTGYVNLRRLNSGPLLGDAAKRSRSPAELPTSDDLDRLAADYNDEVAQTFDYKFRITPVCCTNKAAPWPFFRDDSIASIVLDTRSDVSRRFDASQIATLCSRLSEAEAFATRRLDTLKGFSHPIILQEAPLPYGRAPDWRLRRFSNICTNLCDHPTFCLDTGSCACGHAAQCTPPTRFPFSSVANMDVLSYPPPKKDNNPGADDALVKTLERSSWANIINPDARRYFGSSPQWPPLTSVRDPDMYEDIKQGNASKFYSLKNSWMGCFSADTVMERASKLISKPYVTDQSLVFLPFYSVNDFMRYPNPVEFVDNAMAQLPLHRKKEVDPNDISMTFTHDFGRCNMGILDVLMLRKYYEQPSERHRRVTAWAPMGDLNSPCYYPDQDVVIPARTCLQDQLREAFEDVRKIKPARQRSVLVTFKGRTDGIFGGSIVRQKITCERPMSPGRLEGAEKLERWWQQLKPNSNYLQTINETVFCPLPRGTTGWATRMTDVIYGGCIPVLFGDQTHHMFWDVLDWSKFAIFIDEWDMERLEEILLSYTWEQIEQLQANLILARDAFIYPAEDKMDDSLKERSPFWFAVHSTWLRKLTKYPT